MKTKCVITVPQLFFTKQPLPSAVIQVPSCCFVLCVGNVSKKIAVTVIFILWVCEFVYSRFFPEKKITFITQKFSAMCKTNHFLVVPCCHQKHGFFELPHFWTKPGGVLLEQGRYGKTPPLWKKHHEQPSQVLVRIISMYGRFREAQTVLILFGCFVFCFFFLVFFLHTWMDVHGSYIVTIVSKLGDSAYLRDLL